MFGLFERPRYYRRSPSLFDDMFSFRREMMMQDAFDMMMFPELQMPHLYFVSATNGDDDDKEKEKKEEDAQKTIKKEEKPEQKKEITEEKKEEPKEDENHPEQAEKEEVKEEEQPANDEKKEVIEAPQEKKEEPECFTMDTRTISKKNGYIKHIISEERGEKSGVVITKETRQIGDKSMTLIRKILPDGNIEEKEERENVTDEDMEEFKKQWFEAFPRKQLRSH